MKLYQALKAKKKIAADLSQLWKRFHESNSTVKGAEKNYDPKTLWDGIQNKSDELIALKVAIQSANKPILEKIYKIAELKSRASGLKSLDTRNGIDASHRSYSELATTIEYEAIFKKTEVDKIISDTEAEIAKLQDEIEQYNFNTEL